MTGARDRPPLEVEGVTVAFGPRTALVDATVSVEAGEVVGLAGPNGSGKTTLLRAALGLVPLERGIVRLSGEDVGRLDIRERARRVAWVPQTEAPQDNVPAFDYVLFGRYAHLAPFEGERAEDRHHAEAALRAVDLWERRGSGILELSGGERQRVLLARALAQEAPLLLLDEPTAHLDVGHQLDLLDRVRSLAHRHGTAVVVALHDLNLAARYVERVLVLDHGRIVNDGSPSEILSPELLREVWGVDAELRVDPRSG
ncbi:MAG TPA: ABC transporter ATP-binding protein, partial [Thermoplasmata archaeon]|nr:ABC transporter ATP-binding protein [Thermoplasmata archaeon]